MGNLRNKYTDEEWNEMMDKIDLYRKNKSGGFFDLTIEKKDYIITEHLGSEFGKVKVHRLIQVTKDHKDGFVEGIRAKSKGEVFCEEVV